MTAEHEEKMQEIRRRVGAVHRAQWALDLWRQSDNDAKIKISIECGPEIEGPLVAIIDPIVEIGLVHSRALLEFLGLGIRDDRLTQRKNGKPDDLSIEEFIRPDGNNLEKIVPCDAIKKYRGSEKDAKLALISIISAANKHVAHLTKAKEMSNDTGALFDIAIRGVLALMQNSFYTPLGLEFPVSPITKTRRNLYEYQFQQFWGSQNICGPIDREASRVALTLRSGRATEDLPMLHYVGILEGEGGNWGVRIFDIDGCVGAGETPEEAIAGATEALRDVVSYKRSGGHPVHSPSTVAQVLASGEMQPGESTVLIPLVVDAGRSVRANLTLDAGLLDAVDRAAATAGVTRSAYFASAVRDKLMMA